VTSSAALFPPAQLVYGEPIRMLIDEAYPKHPINPCGRSKWMEEQMLADLPRAIWVSGTSQNPIDTAGVAGHLGAQGKREDLHV
jgi:UDP-glucose 4-epimerase